jgi:hypothetical protein
MPAPDPQGLDIDEKDDGSFTITCEVWPYGNRRVRIARMIAVSRNISRHGWKCHWCRDPIALFKRTDAQFCSDGCRKRAAHQRRLWRGRP